MVRFISVKMKGQLGVETLIVLSFLIFFLLVIIVFYADRSQDVAYLNNYLEARKICFDLKNAIEDVTTLGNGTIINFSLPQMLNNEVIYEVRVDSSQNIGRILWENRTYTCPIVANVTNRTHLYFNISKGWNSIYNYEGRVIIET